MRPKPHHRRPNTSLGVFTAGLTGDLVDTSGATQSDICLVLFVKPDLTAVPPSVITGIVSTQLVELAEHPALTTPVVVQGPEGYIDGTLLI